MRSSTGLHFIALDHLRALAIFMVFAWHFVHGDPPGSLASLDFVPVFPFSLLAEGHTGVSLFMTLSGYLFAKLLDGRVLVYKAFLWNRALRLLPLLVVVVAVVGLRKIAEGGSPISYLHTVMTGIVLPSLPNGGWSITAEFHFYLVLPILLWLAKISRWLPLAIIAGAVYIRLLIFMEDTTIQHIAYYTIVGRIDQFVMGIMFFHLRYHLANRHVFILASILMFATVYWIFDMNGGLYEDGIRASVSPIWIILTTIEGLAYAMLIAWYDSGLFPAKNAFSAFIGKIGEYSYSIYLLHFFVVFDMARWVHEHVMELSNFYLALLWSVVGFLMMIPIGYLSYRYIEMPFLKLRRPYVTPSKRELEIVPL